MTHQQLHACATLAPDAPIIGLALLIRIAETPSTLANLASPVMPVDRVRHIVGLLAWHGLAVLAADGKVCLTVAGWALVDQAQGEVA
jgi:hypothetical protein